jgi:hypothetical protein
MGRRTTARVVGSLFLTATAAGVVSAVLLGPLDSWNAPQAIADNAHRTAAGALLVLVMAAAIALIPPALFPVLAEHGQAPALGYLAARILEVVLLLPAAIGPLVLVAMGTTRSAGAEPLDTVRVLAQTYEVSGQAGSALFFCLGALLLNYLLYRSRLVPRWIAGWALVAVVPYLVDACLVTFGVLEPFSVVHTILFLPLALNEMVLAVWLLTRGFTLPTEVPGGVDDLGGFQRSGQER